LGVLVAFLLAVVKLFDQARHSKAPDLATVQVAELRHRNRNTLERSMFVNVVCTRTSEISARQCLKLRLFICIMDQERVNCRASQGY
jgi:hypothetical protein